MKSNDEAARHRRGRRRHRCRPGRPPEARHRSARRRSPRRETADPARTPKPRSAQIIGHARQRAARHRSSRNSPRWWTRCPATKAGCTSSSTTACACCAAAMARTCAASRAMASTGRTRCGPSSRRWRHSNLSGAWVDGELIVTDPNGRSDFSLLQHILEQGRLGELQYCAFDLLYWNGEDLRDLPLAQRKARLDTAFAKLPAKGPLRLADQIHSDSAQLLARVCNQHLEGLIAKKVDSHLLGRPLRRTGSRSSAPASRSSSWAAPPICPAAARARSPRCWWACAPARASCATWGAWAAASAPTSAPSGTNA